MSKKSGRLLRKSVTNLLRRNGKTLGLAAVAMTAITAAATNSRVLDQVRQIEARIVARLQGRNGGSGELTNAAMVEDRHAD